MLINAVYNLGAKILALLAMYYFNLSVIEKFVFAAEMTPQSVAQADLAVLITVFEIILWLLFTKKVVVEANIRTKNGGNTTTLTDNTLRGPGQIVKVQVNTLVRNSLPKTLSSNFLSSNKITLLMHWAPDNWLSIEGKNRAIKSYGDDTVIRVNNGLRIKAFEALASGSMQGKAINDDCYIRILDKDTWRQGSIMWRIEYHGNYLTRLLTKLFVVLFVKLQLQDHDIQYIEVHNEI